MLDQDLPKHGTRTEQSPAFHTAMPIICTVMTEWGNEGQGQPHLPLVAGHQLLVFLSEYSHVQLVGVAGNTVWLPVCTANIACAKLTKDMPDGKDSTLPGDSRHSANGERPVLLSPHISLTGAS